MSERALVFGWGINDADYHLEPVVNGKRARCPFYRKWYNMIKRCYSESRLNEYPTYRGCSVAEEWRKFSDFKRWMERQDWKDKLLDKDILINGNKIYSSKTCAFVHPIVNNFATNAGKIRGKYKIGVCFNKAKNRLQAHCSNPFTKRVEHLGYFSDESEAHLAWALRKHELAIQLANSEYVSDPRIAEALRARYANLLEAKAEEQEAQDG